MAKTVAESKSQRGKLPGSEPKRPSLKKQSALVNWPLVLDWTSESRRMTLVAGKPRSSAPEFGNSRLKASAWGTPLTGMM